MAAVRSSQAHPHPAALQLLTHTWMLGKSVFFSVATTAAVGVSLPSRVASGRIYGLMPWGGGGGRDTRVGGTLG